MIGSGISSRRLVGRVAEHHPLVAGADLVERVVVARVVLHLEGRVDALGDVGRLLVDRDDHAAGLGVEAVLGARVADLADRARGRGAGCRRRSSVVISPATTTRPVVTSVSQATRPMRIVGEHGVEDGVGDLVGDLVRVALGHRLGREGEASRRHRGTLAGGPAGTAGPEPTRRSGVAPSGRLRARAAAVPSRTAHTPSVIGSSIPSRRERSRSTGAVVSPSTTCPISASASLGRRAARDQLAGAAVAAVSVPAGDDQVAHPRQPGERLRLGAERLAEPGHLDEPAGDRAPPSRCRRARARRRRRRRARSRSSPRRRARRRRGRRSRRRGRQLELIASWSAPRELAVLARDHRRARAGPRRPPRRCSGPRARRPGGRARASRAARRSPGRGPSSG